MINSISLLFLLLSIPLEPVKPNKPVFETAIVQLAKDLTSKHYCKHKELVAILEFRTVDDKASKINQLIQKELSLALADLPNFQLIEQYSVNHLVEELGWSLANATSFKFYSSLNESLYKSTGDIADIFIYGTVTLDGENVLITGYLVPDGVARKTIKSSIQITVGDIPENILD